MSSPSVERPPPRRLAALDDPEQQGVYVRQRAGLGAQARQGHDADGHLEARLNGAGHHRALEVTVGHESGEVGAVDVREGREQGSVVVVGVLTQGEGGLVH